MPPPKERENPEDPVESAFDAFREAWFAGKRPDPEAFFKRFPESLHELRARIENFLYVAGGLPLGDPEGHGGGEGIAGRVLGDFRILREIGRGGMGVVYEAVQLSLNRKVALKVLPAHLSISSESIRKFKREAEAGGRQIHPGIVAVFAVGEHEGFHYIAQELVEGGRTLEDWLEDIRKGGGSPECYFREAAMLLAAVAEALDHAHKAGVIHRDVKPSNILLAGEGRPKVTDFGLARVEGALALSRTGDFSGTPYYMSPEQITNRRGGIDARTDVYSLGVTLYETLTFKKPFEGESSYEVLKKIPVVDPMDPQRVNPRVPRDLSVICQKAMEKQPERRYLTMKEFGDDLQRFLNGEVILARPAGPAVRMMKRVRRNPVLSGAIGAILLLSMALMVWGVVYFFQMRRNFEEVRRLSDRNLVSYLEARALELWPAYPEMADEMKKWMEEAEGLLTRYARYRVTLSGLQEKSRLNADEADLQAFLEELVKDIGSLGNEGTGLVKEVADHLHFAETIREKSIDDYGKEWDRAAASIADARECPEYGGIAIRPKVGFVPIGRDPESGLWEFAHLQTGTVPKRGQDGKLEITEETGLVFVLIPGGTFMMGAQRPTEEKPLGAPNVDPLAESNEQPVHEVTIRPFLLSKYEMTQDQWTRFSGENPSAYPAGTEESGLIISPLHPVENISWEDCSDLLSRLKLRLPSESEWEYAARAGTTTVWYTGNEMESLDGAANVRDSYSKESEGDPAWNYDVELNDGYAFTAPIGRFRPNAFGLHDVIGNLWEWCQDSWGEYEITPRDGSAHESAETTLRMNRGGSWFQTSGGSRVTDRNADSRNSRCDFVGVRPAATIESDRPGD